MTEDNQNTTMPVTPKPQTNPETENNKEKPEKEKMTFFRFIKKRWRGLIILLLLLVCACLYLWKEFETKGLEKKFRADSLLIVNKTNHFIRKTDSSYLKLIAYTFSWAVRGEMTRNNFEQVGQFVTSLVKQPGFIEIMIANNDGKVIISSNKKYETTDLKDFFAYNYINLTDVAVVKHPEDNEIFIGLSPVMNLNTKIGTLLFTFKVSKINI